MRVGGESRAIGNKVVRCFLLVEKKKKKEFENRKQPRVNEAFVLL